METRAVIQYDVELLIASAAASAGCSFEMSDRRAYTVTVSETRMMDPARAEAVLGVLYVASAATSLISAASLVVAWQHWAWTLDVCINFDCGCILYGVNTFSTFMGGDVKLCHYGSFGLIPAIIAGIGLGFYHGYRSCIPRSLSEPRALAVARHRHSRTSLDGQVVVIGPRQRAPCKQWMPAAFIAVLICCLSLAHAVVLTDGYYKTCEQYRRNLVRLLNSTGQELQAIHNRLSCGAILDFMDYIQPDANNWRRSDAINTGLALQLAIVMSWLNFFSWVTIFLVNINMARQRFKSLNEKMCCC
ncbi:uncharacterized protein LOC100118396 isoform X2 [Nasonia vitripennis]|uniref:Uncharacterized protein n=1 Tax=Nasonia vitripennis TaxID=7425 RepID=A0A7M7LLP4_NASVI|nr:uncharacterized protein LOC100118396 isoform X2 [Nasonia vitripennis]